MGFDDFKNLSNDSDLIPGIYNYCDRWCKRCYLSSRCLSFKTEMKEDGKMSSRDVNNKEFWDELNDIFDITLDMLYELTEEEEIDLSDLEHGKLTDQKIDDTEIENHAVNNAAEIYYKSSREWLNLNYELIKENTNECKELFDKEINILGNANGLIINDLFEIISWYHSMILVKTNRAVMSLFDSCKVDEIQNDMNGTAKVVLNGIDRSSFAWNGILQYMPDQEGAALQSLANLQSLKLLIHEYFPLAEKFIRPGFDENLN